MRKNEKKNEEEEEKEVTKIIIRKNAVKSRLEQFKSRNTPAV